MYPVFGDGWQYMNGGVWSFARIWLYDGGCVMLAGYGLAGTVGRIVVDVCCPLCIDGIIQLVVLCWRRMVGCMCWLYIVRFVCVVTYCWLCVDGCELWLHVGGCVVGKVYWWSYVVGCILCCMLLVVYWMLCVVGCACVVVYCRRHIVGGV